MGHVSMELWVALAVGSGLVALFLVVGNPLHRLRRRRSRLPRALELVAINEHELPDDARAPLAFLTGRLSELGFEEADTLASVPAMRRFGHRMYVAPFVHAHEQAYFLMGIESGLQPKSQLVLHIISCLDDGRRIETTTLEALDHLRPGAGVEAQVVLDAETVDEIWSRHRLALTQHRRELRRPARPDAWRGAALAAYEGWVQSAVRAQRLQLDADGEMYRVRSRPRSVW